MHAPNVPFINPPRLIIPPPITPLMAPANIREPKAALAKTTIIFRNATAAASYFICVQGRADGIRRDLISVIHVYGELTAAAAQAPVIVTLM